MAAEDSYNGPLTLEEPDDSWIVPMSTNHESGLDMDTSMEDTSARLPQDNNAEGMYTSMADATSDLPEVTSAMNNGQQVEEPTEPTSSNAGAPTDASTDIKRELDSPGTEESPKTKSRRRRGDAEPDYSGLTREKVKNNKRTGQACDRCKVRRAIYIHSSALHPFPLYGTSSSPRILIEWTSNSSYESCAATPRQRDAGNARPHLIHAK